MLKTISDLTINNSILTSKDGIIKGIDSDNSLVDENKIIDKVNIVNKANIGTFQAKIFQSNELVQQKKSGVRFLIFGAN